MAQHRYRHRKIKREHTIIEGLLPVLEKISEIEAVQSITPGRIKQRSRTGPAGLFFQYETDTGLKLIGRSPTAVQEVFVVTGDPKGVIDALVAQGLIQGRHSPNALEPEPLEKLRQLRRSLQHQQREERRRRQQRGHHRSSPPVQALEPSPPLQPLQSLQPPQSSPQLQHGPQAHQSGRLPRGEHPEIGEHPESEAPGTALKKVEPELWNELLRLHQELLDLEKRLGEPPSPVRPDAFQGGFD